MRVCRKLKVELGRLVTLTFALGAVFVPAAHACAQQNLLPDPSIEETRSPNQFGIPYVKWSGWNFEGGGVFRNGKLARTGKTCAELIGAPGCKLRLYSPTVTVPAGRYRFTCYIRGLDIGVHAYGLSEDVNFGGDKYYALKKSGTFGWTRLDIVSDEAAGDLVFRIGLWSEGRLWIDDASLTAVPVNTPVTNGPVLAGEEAPVAAPGALDAAAGVRCPECGYRNMPAWKHCYACGEPLGGQRTAETGPASKSLVQFTEGKLAPFDAAAGGAEVSRDHAPVGQLSLRLNSGYAVWDGLQDWSGFDFFKTEVYNAADSPTTLYIEIQDTGTTDYWTRVNYNTVVPPGASTLVVPTALYVGEKSRPGRALDKAHIKRFVFSISDTKQPVYFNSLRLERDLSDSVHVPGLQAYSFGPGSSSPLSGFTPVTPSTIYTPGRGYGLKGTQVNRTYDVLQPDPLYEKGIFFENAGGFAIDLPNGMYHVFVNADYPSGFWGEYQVYQTRRIEANGALVSEDIMDLARFQRKYFRFANTEDSPSENTFDKYQTPYFQEKQFDVEVRNGQLYLEFDGDSPFANAVSAIVVYPAAQDTAGKRYLANLRERRRFYFDNYFKRVLPVGDRDEKGSIPVFEPTAAEKAVGYAVFARDWMRDVPVNGVPRREEITQNLSIFASAGQEVPIVFSVYPLKHLGQVSVEVSDLHLASASSVIPASAFAAGVVSHRLTRVTGEGTVYTISPRYILPRGSADVSPGATTTFWLTLHTPDRVKAGEYVGRISIKSAAGGSQSIELHARLFATKLDELDVAAGPWGSSLALPWNRPEDLGNYSREMFRKSLAKMREYGCTTFSGIPTIRIAKWKDRQPVIDFRQGDQEMEDARAAGFKDVVINYNGGIGGFDNYNIDEAAMRSAGFSNYVEFLRAVLSAVDAHAKSAHWLPVAFNLCDEPIGDAAKVSAANAKAWAEAAPKGMLTTGATSVEGAKSDDPHFELARALRVPDLNDHDDVSVRAIQANGGQWAFYNGGSRWTFGAYMFKCAQEYGMKFRLSWHWNVAAGDPYYALDCREDDYCWCATNANRDLIPSLHFDREIRAGIDDYRYMLTLKRLISARPNSAGAAEGKKLLVDKLSAFKLGERNHDAKWPASEYQTYQLKLAEAIEKLAHQALGRQSL